MRRSVCAASWASRSARCEKYATPLEEATTPSLEALKAYSLGAEDLVCERRYSRCLPFYKRAVELDPNFAMAYARAGGVYDNLGETHGRRRTPQGLRAAGEGERAGDGSTSSGVYYQNLDRRTGEGGQVYELWQQAYPQETPLPSPTGSFISLGRLWTKPWWKAARPSAWTRQSVSIMRTFAVTYFSLNRLEEADAVSKQAEERRRKSRYSCGALRFVWLFLKDDAEGMANRWPRATGKPGVEDSLLATEADTAAYSGQLGKARELSRRAVASAQHEEEKETAASYEARQPSAKLSSAIQPRPGSGSRRH